MNYTTVEQSRKLLELGLSHESADMWYHGHNGPMLSDIIYDDEPTVFQSQRPNWDLPCWSVGALIKLLPEKVMHNNLNCECMMSPTHVGYYSLFGNIEKEGAFTICWGENPDLTDALYNCAIWLLENNHIEKKEKK